MKRLAFLCLVITMGTIALAQQPTEWRPNISEDNKAATQADTVTFITQMLTKGDSLRTLSVNSDAECKLAISNVALAQFQRPMQHMLEMPNQPTISLAIFDGNGVSLQRVGAKMHFWTIRLENRQIDFGRIDPLEIEVKPTQQMWTVRIAGTSGQAIGSKVSATYEGKIPNDQDNLDVTLHLIQGLGLTVPCSTHPPDALSCKTTETSVTDTEFLVSDLEIAHRIARAMMHEALVCGGKKAVSPF
ncbi:MAG: hypothetical protein ABR905_07455 [Terracidiphilus sp.]